MQSREKASGDRLKIAAPFVFKATGDKIQVALEAFQPAPRQVCFRYDLSAEKDVPLTQIAAAIAAGDGSRRARPFSTTPTARRPH